MNKQKKTTIHLGEIARQLDQGVKSADQLRTDSLKKLERVRQARLNSAVRDLVRLKTKLGDKHRRVIALSERHLRDSEFIRDIDFGIKRASAQIEKVAEDIWIVHGRVYSGELVERGGLVVAIQDDECETFVGPVRADKTGYFKLLYKSKKHRKDTSTPGNLPLETKLFLHVSHRDGTPLHRDPRPLRVQLGTAEYREIIIIDDSSPSRPTKKAATKKTAKKSRNKTKKKVARIKKKTNSS